jgi:hypothetical protein
MMSLGADDRGCDRFCGGSAVKCNTLENTEVFRMLAGLAMGIFATLSFGGTTIADSTGFSMRLPCDSVVFECLDADLFLGSGLITGDVGVGLSMSIAAGTEMIFSAVVTPLFWAAVSVATPLGTSTALAGTSGAGAPVKTASMALTGSVLRSSPRFEDARLASDLVAR